MTFFIKCASCEEVLERKNPNVLARCFKCKVLKRNERNLNLTKEQRDDKSTRQRNRRRLKRLSKKLLTPRSRH